MAKIFVAIYTSNSKHKWQNQQQGDTKYLPAESENSRLRMVFSFRTVYAKLLNICGWQKMKLRLLGINFPMWSQDLLYTRWRFNNGSSEAMWDLNNKSQEISLHHQKFDKNWQQNSCFNCKFIVKSPPIFQFSNKT